MRLDDAAVSLLESLDHVENVYPVLQLNIVAKYGQYVDDYMTIQGMTPEGLQALNIEIGDGKMCIRDRTCTSTFPATAKPTPSWLSLICVTRTAMFTRPVSYTHLVL